MSWAADFMTFCQEHDLDPDKPSSMDFWKAGVVPTAAQPCPKCGHAVSSGHCYYCGEGKRPTKSPEQRAVDEMRALRIWDAASLSRVP